MFAELIYALRGLRRSPTFTVAAVVSLTLGVATSSIVFSLVDAAMLRTAPFADAERVVVLNITQRSPSEGEQRHRWSWRRFELLRQNAQSFEEVATSSNAVVTITGVADPEPLAIELVSTRYLALMQAPLLLGQALASEAESGPAASQTVLSYGLWQRRFGGSADVVGQTLALNGVPFTVIGVADRSFAGISGRAQAWLAAAAAPAVTYRDYLVTNQNFITVVGRLRQGVSLEAARAELSALGKRIHTEQPSEADTPDDQFSATAITLNDARIDVVTRRALVLLAGAVAVLLLIACANVASLLLGRAIERRREIAIRIAVGARSRQLIRQLLMESAVLAALSAVLTVGLLLWVLPLVQLPPTLFRGRNFYGAVGEFATPALDLRVLAFTAALCAGTILLFGLLPAWRGARTDVDRDLRSGGSRSTTDSRTGGRMLAVAFQVALALVLTVACGLLLTSYARLRQTALGFDPDRLLTFMVRPSEVKYDTEKAPALLDRVLEEIARVPAVDQATVDGCAPLSMQCAIGSLQIVGRPRLAPAAAPAVLRHYVAPSHFRTLGVPIIRGRGLTADDRSGRPRVVVINQAAAARFWPNEDPIGQRVWFDDAPGFGSPEESAEVVGVAGNVTYLPLDENPVQPGFFTSYAQFTYATRMVLVRTRGEPLAAVPQIAEAVRRADPDLALFDIQTMESRAGQSWAKHGFQAALFSIVGLIALFLAAAGVYAVAAQMVASRTREIGMRMALGASPFQIARNSTAQTVRLGLAGVGAGLAGCLFMTRAMAPALYDTSPFDPLVLLGAISVLCLALAAATSVPVRRALRVNPIEALRGE